MMKSIGQPLSSPQRIGIILLSPPGYQHSGAFREIAETLLYGFRALGAEAKIFTNTFPPDFLHLVLGLHLLPPALIPALPPDTVMYNLEQVEESLFDWAPQLREAFSRLEVWDYSHRNLERLRQMGFSGRFHCLPVGTMPQMSRIKSAPVQDIDVLFYGVVNERRRLVLKAIQDRGFVVRAAFGYYGEARDALIARAKLVLNLHKHQAQVFEIVRVSYLLANHKAVVSEIAPETEIDAELCRAVAGAPYQDLVETCVGLIGDETARSALAERGFQVIDARRQDQLIARVMAERA